MMDEIAQWIILLRGRVDHIEFRGMKIESTGTSLLLTRLLDANLTLISIKLSHNSLDSSCMKALGEYIKGNDKLKDVDLCYNKIDDHGVEIISDYIVGNKTLQSIRLSGNLQITDLSFPFLMRMIDLSDVKVIEVFQTLFTQHGALSITRAIKLLENKSSEIILRQEHITDKELYQLCEALKKIDCRNLSKIDLFGNDITSQAVSMLLKLLKECKAPISRISLHGNNLDDRIMKDLGELIHENHSLESIDLGRNQITDVGVEVISEYIIGTCHLIFLSLVGNNKITEPSFPLFIQMAKESHIQEFNLDGTMIPEEKQMELSEILLFPVDKRHIPIKSTTKSAHKR